MASGGYRDDIRYKQGRKLLQENKFEEAIEFFSSLLQSQITAHGEQTIDVAPIWFEYGRALLMKEQENPTDDLLGAVAEEAKKQAKVLGEELNGAENGEEEDEEEEEKEEEGGQQEGEGETGDGEDGEDASDMEVAWEALEVARKIFESEQNPEYDLQLSEVYESLGDIHRFNGNFSGSIEEYQRSLELREAACEDNDRLLAQAYYSLAVANVYLSGDIPADGSVAPLSPAAILSLKKTALRNYQKAKDVLLRSPPPSTAHVTVTTEASHFSSAPSSSESTSTSSTSTPATVAPVKAPLTEEEERKELCDEISETITALQEEIISLEMPNGSSSSSNSSSRPNPSAMIGASTTTIGFGQPSSSSAIPLLEVKRKAPSSQPPASTPPEDSQKKTKI